VNPFYTLIPDSKIALSDINSNITYNDLINKAIEKRDWLVTLGYKHGHRIGIAGDNSIRTYTYFLAAQMLSSAVGLRAEKEAQEADWNHKIPAAKINVVLELGNDDRELQVHHYHYDKSTECPKEYSVYFSSGTTNNNWGKSQATPMVWDIDDHNWGMGIDIVNYNRAVINPHYRESPDNIQIQAMASWIGFGQESVTLNLIKHGHTVLVDKLADWDTLVERHKPTWTVMFPMIAFKLMAKNTGTVYPIKCVEMAGAKVTKKQLKDMKQFFNCNYFVSHYGTSQSGNSFHNSGDGSNLNHIGKPCQGFIHAYGDEFARIGEHGTLEVKWHGSPPYLSNSDGYYDTGDIVQIREDGNWEFLGRSNEMLMIRGGSKLQAPSIEDMLLEHPAIKEAYIYPIPEYELTNSQFDISKDEHEQGYLYQSPGLLYYGDITPEELNHYCQENIPSYNRPVQLFQLKDKLAVFQPGNIWKVRRLAMHDTLKEKHNEWCKAYKC
jgi:acyl-coenzyme A synthetase/AMP-(fatty) acid ligase|tara:strand:+ start:302 stop:1783 length:1482 start_codon:yes stop_codon:yes gene_type:complete